MHLSILAYIMLAMTENPHVKKTTHNLIEFTVEELSRALKGNIENSFSRVRVRGEITGLKRAESGHLYLRLKGDASVLDGVCWRPNANRLKINPVDGMEIIATGRITAYSPRSSYQIIIDQLEPAGEGALLKLLEDRKKKLANEGLFDESKKQKLPFLPEIIGVISSSSGAVIRDILRRLSDRFPVRVVLWPVLVQGDLAAKEISEAIEGFDKLNFNSQVPRPELLIVARGGGSLEDLMAFNEESVVRAVAACSIPLISAVGHETDTTLIDFSSDVRAPTPTAAAELAVPVRSELLVQVLDDGRRLLNAVNRNVHQKKIHLESLSRGLPNLRRVADVSHQRLDYWTERLSSCLKSGLLSRKARLAESAAALLKPEQKIKNAYLRLDSEVRALIQFAKGQQSAREHRLNQAAALLESFSYQRILERGFVLVNDQLGNSISSVRDIEYGVELTMQFYDGKILVKASEKLYKNKIKSKKREQDEGGDQGSLL